MLILVVLYVKKVFKYLEEVCFLKLLGEIFKWVGNKVRGEREEERKGEIWEKGSKEGGGR